MASPVVVGAATSVSERGGTVQLAPGNDQHTLGPITASGQSTISL
jgi:hypothetical protein